MVMVCHLVEIYIMYWLNKMKSHSFVSSFCVSVTPKKLKGKKSVCGQFFVTLAGFQRCYMFLIGNSVILYTQQILYASIMICGLALSMHPQLIYTKYTWWFLERSRTTYEKHSLSTVSRVNISQLAGGQKLEESKGVKVKLNLHTRKKFFSLVS
jgi:hypothetical protein